MGTVDPDEAERSFQRAIARLLHDAQAQGIETHQWGIWCQVGKSGELGDVPKIHLSVGLDELESALAVLRALALEHGVVAKVVKDVPSAERLSSGAYGMAQVGKPFSFYPRDAADFRRVMSLLLGLTSQFSGVLPHGDVRARGSHCLSVRHKTWDRHSRPSDQQLEALNQRFPGMWADASPSQSLPLRYVPLEFVAVRGSGFRLRALDLDASRRIGEARTVFIKQALPEGERDINGVDAVARLEFEVSMYERLEGVRGIPRYIENFTLDDGSSYLVTQFCEGDTLASLKAGALSDEQFDFLSTFLFEEILPEFHRRGLLLGDLSDDNFMRDAKGGIYFIDLDGTLVLPATGTYLGRHTELFRPPDWLAGRVEADAVLAVRLLTKLRVGVEGLRSIDQDVARFRVWFAKEAEWL